MGGLKLDPYANERMIGLEGQISTDGSALHAFVIPTDEELLIARDTVRCVLKQQRPQVETDLKAEEVRR